MHHPPDVAASATLDEESKKAWKDKDKHFEEFRDQITVTELSKEDPKRRFWADARSGSIFIHGGPYRILRSNLSKKTVGVLIRPEYDVLWRTAEMNCKEGRPWIPII
jgi:hypothetical protein